MFSSEAWQSREKIENGGSLTSRDCPPGLEVLWAGGHAPRTGPAMTSVLLPSSYNRQFRAFLIHYFSMEYTSEQLSTFLRALTIDRGHLGLLVTKGDPGDVVVTAPADGADVIALSEDTDAESVLDRLAVCAHEARWCRLHLLDGTLPGRVYNQLRSIATTGHGEARGKDFLWPDVAKIVVCVSEETEAKISVPTFLNLFGPILRAS
jgi:hypothetical protein